MRLPHVLRDRDAQANFDDLVKRLGFERVKIGSGTVTWPGATPISDPVTVDHGLGSTPRAVLVTGNTNQGEVVAFQAYGKTSTQFQVEGEFVRGFMPGAGAASGFDWVAYA